jgi:hypothetical protein
MGGLGNQLFQIFATISYAMEHNQPFIFPFSKKLSDRNTYWDSLFSRIHCFTTNGKIAKMTIDQLLLIEPSVIEKEFNYGPLLSPLNPVTKLYGYFQSYKYFVDRFETICSLLQIRQQQEKIKNDFLCYFSYDSPVISVHFRLGDYKNKQMYHPILPLEYYQKALQCFDKTKRTVLYFCEKEDDEVVSTNIEILEMNFSHLLFIKVDNEIEDWKQLLLMSCCDHHIIANSSFSWWGAYLAPVKESEKIVIYPHTWFGLALKTHNTSDMCPPWWKKIDTV